MCLKRKATKIQKCRPAVKRIKEEERKKKGRRKKKRAEAFKCSHASAAIDDGGQIGKRANTDLAQERVAHQREPACLRTTHT